MDTAQPDPRLSQRARPPAAAMDVAGVLRAVGRRGVALAPALGVGLVFLAAWQLYAGFGNVGADVLPPPSGVVSAGWGDRGALWANTLPTLRATVLGFGFAMVAAFLLSVLVDSSAHVRRALMPVLVVSQTLPLIAIAPLLILWFGFGLVPKLLIVALVTFFPLTIAFVEGYAASDPDGAALLRSMGADRWRIFRSLRLPTAVPFFLAGMRIAVTYAVVGAIFAEYAGASEGLGIYMQNAKNAFRADLVLAAVAVSSALTLALFALTYLLERIAAPWLASARSNAATR